MIKIGIQTEMQDRLENAWTIYSLLNFGDLTEQEFGRYYLRAVAFLGAITRGRAERILAEWADGETATEIISPLQEKVLFAAFSTAEQYRLNALHDGAGPVVAATNDGVSVTYAAGRNSLSGSSTGSASQTPEQKLYEAAAQYLRGTGLLYRGIRSTSL